MAPIPEGGYFALGPRTTGLSCITALLTDEPRGSRRCTSSPSTRAGGGSPAPPIDLVTLDASGTGTRRTLDASTPQVLVPRGDLAGANAPRAVEPARLLVRPSLHRRVFRLGIREELVLAYPGWATDIERLTRG